MRLGTTRSLFNGSGWLVTSPTSLTSTPSTRSPSFPTPAAPTRSRLRHVIRSGRVCLARRRSARAAQAAIAEFGTPDAVADAFAGELATAYARRTIALFILTGPLVGIWWLLLLQPHPWRTGLVALLVAIPVIPLLPLAIAAAAAALATTGRLIRWLPESSPRQALTATIAIAGAVLLADLTVLAVYAGSNISAQPLAALAITASLLRISCSIITLRHATAIRHGLTATSTDRPV
jgi:hypothetical protein